MTICLAESLIEKGFNLDNQFERYQKWYLFEKLHEKNIQIKGN